MKVAAFVALLGCAVPVTGQSIGASLGGVVTDASGARVSGATITITNVANGRSQILNAGEQGEFRIVALQPAPYRAATTHSTPRCSTFDPPNGSN